MSALSARLDSLEGSARAVLLQVLRYGPVSRADLARRLGLSSGSLTRLTKPLLADGLLREGPAQLRAGTGRPSLPLEIVAGAAHFVGITVTVESIFSVVTDLSGAVKQQRCREVSDVSVAAVVETVAAEVGLLRRSHPDIETVGVAVGGMVADHRTVWGVHALGWDETNLRALLEARVGLPVIVENDVKAFTHAEHWFGEGRGLRSLAVITVGVGIGCAFVADDQLVTGHRGLAGLLDHWPLVVGGPVCHLGHVGCVHAVLSNAGLEQQAANALGRRMAAADCIDLARGGDAIARALVDDAAYQLGRFAALVANLLAPQRLLLSGDGIGYGVLAEGELRRGFGDARHPTVPDDDLVVAELGFFAWARGAAAMAIRDFVLAKAAPVP